MSEQAAPAVKVLPFQLRWQLLIAAAVVGVAGALYLALVPGQGGAVALPVPAADLPAYHLVLPSDVVTATVAANAVPAHVIGDASDLSSRYTLAPLPAKKPIDVEQTHVVPNCAVMTDTVAVGLQATSAMVLGGNLQAGEIVDLVVVPAQTDGEPSPRPILFQDVLVLDVKPAAGREAGYGEVCVYTHTVIVAVPSNRLLEFASMMGRASFLITRKP